jgi:hypothetical protein
MKHKDRFAAQHAAPQVMPCPRCKHLSRFQQASSDHAWVCQRCLRVRIQLFDADRVAAHAAQPAKQI